VTDVADFHPLPGAFEAVARLNRAGWPVSIVTNQSCVGRGLATAEQIAAVHDACRRTARDKGAVLDGIHVCPHAPDDHCTCRKPLPGLLLEAADAHGYDLFRSYFVGDSLRDLLAGRAAGATPLLVLTGRDDGASARHPAHLTFRSLGDAVDWILARPREAG
jgi:D-glycero-D-manno-heptose 1,7-bisphosphate phosphatase